MVNGTLKQEADGSFSLDAVVSTDHTVSMDVKMKSSQGAPLDVRKTAILVKYMSNIIYLNSRELLTLGALI